MGTNRQRNRKITRAVVRKFQLFHMSISRASKWMLFFMQAREIPSRVAVLISLINRCAIKRARSLIRRFDTAEISMRFGRRGPYKDLQIAHFTSSKSSEKVIISDCYVLFHLWLKRLSKLTFGKHKKILRLFSSAHPQGLKFNEPNNTSGLNSFPGMKKYRYCSNS